MDYTVLLNTLAQAAMFLLHAHAERVEGFDPQAAQIARDHAEAVRLAPAAQLVASAPPAIAPPTITPAEEDDFVKEIADAVVSRLVGVLREPPTPQPEPPTPEPDHAETPAAAD